VRRDMVERPVGIVDEGGRQNAMPTDKLRHGARSPKP